MRMAEEAAASGVQVHIRAFRAAELEMPAAL